MTEASEHSADPIQGRDVVLCVTGGIACYKAADLASKLTQRGAGVTVAMTEAAGEFVRPLTFESLTRRRVYCSLWHEPDSYVSRHISLTDRADLIVVAPATANVLAKLARGIADDLVTTTVLSSWGACPVLVAPAMNTRMWQAPPTQENVRILRDWGVEFTGPAEGRMACGTVGPGRMVEPADLLETIAALLGRTAIPGAD